MFATPIARSELNSGQALNEAIRAEMRRDETVVVIREDVAGGAGRAHLGLVDALGGPLGHTRVITGRVVGGLVLACVGNASPLTYKRSRGGDALVDRAAEHVVGLQPGRRILDFVPWDWDERQYNSPAFNLAVACLSRSLEGESPEYHSSADDLSVISAESLEGSLEAALAIVDVLEHGRRYVNLSPKGEPQLGKRGLYRGVGGPVPGAEQLALLWVLNQSDGSLVESPSPAGFPSRSSTSRREPRRRGASCGARRMISDGERCVVSGQSECSRTSQSRHRRSSSR